VATDTGTFSALPVPVIGPTGTGTLTGITGIAAGLAHSLALGADGTVWSFGSGQLGALGVGNIQDSSVPEAVHLPATVHAVSITAGYGSGYALTTGGVVESWGDDYDGQLGDDGSVPLGASGPGPGLHPRLLVDLQRASRPAAGFPGLRRTRLVHQLPVHRRSAGHHPPDAAGHHVRRALLRPPPGGHLRPPVTVTATAVGSSPLACSFRAGRVTITGSGTCGLVANQAGNAQYQPAPSVEVSFTVAPAPVTLEGASESGRVGSAPHPQLELLRAGQWRHHGHRLHRAAACTTRPPPSRRRAYPITCLPGTLTSTKYQITAR